MDRAEGLFTGKARYSGNSYSSLIRLIWEIAHGQELLNARYQSYCWQPLGLRGACLAECRDVFGGEAVQADVEE